MTDLVAQIRDDLDYRRSKLVDPDDTFAEIAFEGMRDALLAIVERHEPVHYDGQVQYAYRDEPVFSADGAARGTIQVKGDPLPPDWCATCGDASPCEELLAIGRALRIDGTETTLERATRQEGDD